MEPGFFMFFLNQSKLLKNRNYKKKAYKFKVKSFVNMENMKQTELVLSRIFPSLMNFSKVNKF
jgi:hypothetical protein